MNFVEVTARVFGIYTWGKLKGKTNPKSFVNLTLVAKDVKEAMSRMNTMTGGALVQIDAVKKIAI